MSKHKIAVLPGDGVGPEVIDAAVKVLTSVCDNVDMTFFEVGYGRYQKHGAAITDEIVEEVKKFDAILFGAGTSPPETVKNYKSVVITLRRSLDLYTNIRPMKSYIKQNGLDVVIFRENTEGLYTKRDFIRGDEAVAEKIVTAKKSERHAQLAFERADLLGRKKATIVHKANVLRNSDGLFADVCKRVAKKFPQIQVDEKYIDNACYQLVRDPSQFDVIITTNLYGDILADLAAGVGDGLGFAPSAQFGEKWALFEPVHGSAPDIAGKGVANPVAAVLCVKMMLEYLGEKDKAALVQRAVEDVLSEGAVRTQDIGGTAKTSEMAEAFVSKLLVKSR